MGLCNSCERQEAERQVDLIGLKELSKDSTNDQQMEYIQKYGRSDIKSYSSSSNIFLSKESSIVKFQANWRGYNQRKAFKKLEKSNENSSSFKRFFMKSEAMETLTDRPYDPSRKRQVRSPYTYDTGSMYHGEWVGGFRHGVGTMLWTDGSEYQGQWQSGKADGIGKFQHKNGDYYFGMWKYDKAHGWGASKRSSLDNDKSGPLIMEGQFRDDVMNGFGKIKVINEDSLYEGEFFKGNREGWGILTWPDGSKLEGNWTKGNLNGTGQYIWKDGREYLGEWYEQKLQGVGIYKWKDGKLYKGEYSNDKKNGFGVYTLQDGRTYEGWWVDGKQHGLGTFYFPDIKSGLTKSKKGLWEDGQRIMWLDDPSLIQQIESCQIDYRALMHNEENKTRIHVSETCHLFEKPSYLEIRLNSMEQEMKQKSERHQKDLEYFLQKMQETRNRVDEIVEFTQKIKISGKLSSQNTSKSRRHGQTPDTNS